VKKSYTNEDLIKEKTVASYFYSLTKSKVPNKKSSIFERTVYKLKIKASGTYLKFLSLENIFIVYSTKYYPFSTKFKGHLSHHTFRVERKIIVDFENLAAEEGMWISIKGFDRDRQYACYVGFFFFQVYLEKEIQKLQKVFQKIYPDFYIREYEDGWFKILMPWSIYLKLREEYEKKHGT